MKHSRVSALAHSVRIPRALAFAALLALTIWSPMSLAAQTPVGTPVASRIVAAINPNQRVTLPGSTPAIARAQYDQGALAESAAANHVVLVLKRSDEQESTLKALIDQMHSKGSANYQQWLNPQEFASRFGPSDADLATVTGWLQQNGFTVNKVSAGKVAIDFSGTAGQIKSAFHTELHTYTHNGVTFHSNNQDPQIPAALAPVVAGIESLNDIKPVSNMHVPGTAKMNIQTHTATPDWNFEANCTVAGSFTRVPCTLYIPEPSDLAVQYNLTSVQKSGITGKGATVGVISASNIDLGVVQNYRNLFGFNAANLPQVVVDGSDPGQTGAVTEAYLDVEAIAAMAPDATTNLYVSADTLTTSGLVTAIIRAVDDDVADVLTLSYGECEKTLGAAGNQFFYQAWEQAAAQGQSVFVSSGDAGSAGCDNFDTEASATQGLAVSGYTSTPFNTSVGGTDFYYTNYATGQFSAALIAELATDWSGGGPSITPTASLTAPIREQPWNQSLGFNVNKNGHGHNIVGGSGGASTCASGANVNPTTGAYGLCTAGYAKPSWQSGIGVPADGVRDIPDVSLFASSGANLAFWPICASVYDCRADLQVDPYSISITAIGGTSASSPAMAGIMALVDQNQKGRQGNANYTLYALATQYPNTFNDITLGSNNVVCTAGTVNCSLDTNGDGYYSLQEFFAGAGYDQASGLGTINGANLLANWGKVSFNASPKASSTTLAVAQTTFVHGTPVAVTATVKGAGGTPSGAVAIVSSTSIPGQTGQGTIPLLNGTGTDPINFLPGGNYSLTGAYPGDSVFGTSTSAPVSVTVSPEPSTVTLSGLAETTFHVTSTLANGSSVPYSDTLYLQAQVVGKSGFGTASGQVTFMDGTTVLGSANVSSNSEAIFPIGTLSQGAHNLSASYSGDPSFNASTSGSLSITTTPGIVQMNMLDYLYASYSPKYFLYVYAGQPFVTNLILDGGYHSLPPSGTATVTFGSLPPQTVTVSPSFFGAPLGTATLTFLPTTPGTYVLNASYPGDTNYGPATLPRPITIQVLAPTLAPTTTTFVPSTTSVGPDGFVSVAISVTGSISGVVPTGTASVLVHGSTFSSKLDNTGKVTIHIAGYNMIPGANQMLASYNGDSNYATSDSAPVTVTVNQGDFSFTTNDATPYLASGGTATAQLTIAQMTSAEQGGLTGPVNLMCTSPSPALTCTLSSSSVNLAANFVPANATVTLTSIPGMAGLSPAPRFPGRGLLGGGVALATLLCCIIPTRRRKLSSLLSMLILLGVGIGATGCSHAKTPAAAAAAGPVSYLVSVQANASGVQHSLQLKVTVQ